jgi:hypothetical protein
VGEAQGKRVIHCPRPALDLHFLRFDRADASVPLHEDDAGDREIGSDIGC